MVAEEFADTHPAPTSLPLSYQKIKKNDHLAGVNRRKMKVSGFVEVRGKECDAVLRWGCIDVVNRAPGVGKVLVLLKVFCINSQESDNATNLLHFRHLPNVI